MTGKFEHSLDTAGRLIVPAKLRDKLGKCFYVAVGVKQNLTIFPLNTWQKLKERVEGLTTTQAAAMDIFFAAAHECEVDKQWRFQIPAMLKEYAQIDRDVVITGNNDRAQIWSADAWQARARESLNPETINSLMHALGI